MAEESHHKKIDLITNDDDHYEDYSKYESVFQSVIKKQAITTSNKTTRVATKILLDDANNGFEKGNVVCSPFSLEIILGMLAFGAEGKTLEQLLEFLGHESIDQLRSMPSDSNILLDTGKGGPDFRLANGVWVDKEVKPIQPSYQEDLKTVYKTKAEYMDVQNKPAESAEIINSWAMEKTNGLIPKIIGELSPDEVMVIANALYFKGTWSKPFAEKNTKNKKFHLINGEKVSIPFMTCYNEFDYGSFKEFKMIKLPYESNGQSNAFSMYIFLPYRIDGLKDLLQVFQSDHSLFSGYFNLVKRKFNELWIPKFEISCAFEPSKVIKELGLTLPFDKENKELSGIVEQKHLYDKKLYVSTILQKSFIKVDENGTEAAAITTLRVTKSAKRSPPPARFVANHPFMFMIRENTSCAILFTGVVVDPQIKS